MNVADYYDSNTRRFLKFGRLGELGVVHRGVWAPGVTEPESAAHYVHDLIAKDLRGRDASVSAGLDLGCGVGAGMVRIGEQTGASIAGITISSTQAEIARERLAPRYMVRTGDFCTPEAYAGVPAEELDFAYFIESFVHAPEPRRLLRLLTERLKPGARVYLCDDFLGRPPENAREETILRNYQVGWHINTLVDPMELHALCADHGLLSVESRSLTPFLKLNRTRDLLIRLAVPLLRPFGRNRPWWDNMLGGDALQRALSRGLINYRFEIFEYRPKGSTRPSGAR